MTKSLLLALYVIVGLTAFRAKSPAQSAPQTVLVLDDSDPDSPFSRRIREQLQFTLDQDLSGGYAIYTEFLNLGHFSEANYDTTLHDYIRDKYGNKPIKTVVTIGARALRLALGLRADTWPRTPIVFETFDGPLPAGSVPPNVTGIIAPRPFRDLVKSARLLVPKLAQVVLVGDPISRQPYRHHYQLELGRSTRGLKVVDLTGKPFDQVKARVATLPEDSAIIYLPIFGDISGKIHSPGEAISALSEVANRPIVVDANAFIGKGATGGIVPSARALGKETGSLVARILHGESASSIPVESRSFSKPKFDARQLERWGIEESALPPGSDIGFSRPSAWERYRWQIITGILVIIAQAAVIGWLLLEHRRRQRAERESHQRLLEVTKMDRAMTTGAMSASLSHELKQPLSAILNNAETAKVLLKSKSCNLDEVKEILTEICHDDQRAVEIISHLRALLKKDDIATKDLDFRQLVKDTLRLIRMHAKNNGVTVEASLSADDIRVRADGVHIQQVILNLAMNAIDAMQNIPIERRTLKVTTDKNGDEVVFAVADSGTGIAEAKLSSIFQPFVTTKEQGIGLGLSIARTIIHTYGGKIWAESSVPGGAVFYFTLKAA